MSDFGLELLFQEPAGMANMDAQMRDFDMATPRVHVSNTVASRQQLAAIFQAWQAHQFQAGGGTWLANVGQDELNGLILRMVITMADVGTSAKTRYAQARFGNAVVGAIPAGSFIMMDDLVDDIKRTCTVRQFAAYYAPVYWNWALENDSPPAFWQKKGVTFNNRFAGFDFFHGVESSASIGGPQKALTRVPTDNERKCAQATSRVMIYRAIADDVGFQTNVVEVTNGRNMGHRATLGLLPPATSQNP